MNKLFTLLILIACVFPATAQPVLDYPTNVPQPGDAYTYTTADTNGVSEGAAGANITWDLSGITSNGTSYDYEVLDASTTPYIGTFPTADIAYTETGSEFFQYYDITTTTNEYIGYGSPTLNMIYSDNMKVMNYPFTYGDSFSDNSLYSFESSGYNFTTASSQTIECDGYGTLVMPNGTFSNVLRMKQTATYTSTNDIPGSEATTSTNVTYYWQAENSRFSLASITYSTPEGGATTKSASFNTYSTDVTENLVAEKFSFYPNPTGNQLNLSFKKVENAEIKVTNMLGKVMIEMNLENTNKVTVDLSNFPAGIYFVSLQDENKAITRKVIKK